MVDGREFYCAFEPTYHFNPKFQANANANEVNELKAQLSEAQKLATQYR